MKKFVIALCVAALHAVRKCVCSRHGSRCKNQES